MADSKDKTAETPDYSVHRNSNSERMEWFRPAELDFEHHPIWHGKTSIDGRNVIIAKGEIDPGWRSSDLPVHASCSQNECTEEDREEVIINCIGEVIKAYTAQHDFKEIMMDPLAGYAVHRAENGAVIKSEYGAVIKYETGKSTAYDLITFELEDVWIEGEYMEKNKELGKIPVNEDAIRSFANEEYGLDLPEYGSEMEFISAFHTFHRPTNFKHNIIYKNVH